MNPLKIQDSVLRDFLLEVNLIEPDGTMNSRNFSADDLSPWYDVLQSSIDHDQVMVFLFPTNNKKTDQWLVAGREKYPLQRAFQQVMRFVVPTYALYQGNTPKLIQFDPQNGKAQLLANNLFCGAYTLYAKRDERLKILKRISKWYTVLKFKKIPVALTQGQPTYQKLRFSFEKALAYQDWKSAEQYLLEIQSNNLTTADNLIFLRYQLLSQQSEWKKLWTHREYNQVAEIYVPRDVKRAMLTAFHVTELMQLEANHQFDEALDRFNGLRLKLGSLLTTRQSLKAPQILRVFAYQAASEQNHNALITLKEETQDQLTHTLIDTLYQMFEPPEIILEDVPSEIRKALINSDYDTAWTLSDRLQDWIEQMYMRLQIAVLSYYTEYATISLQEFNGLYPEEQSKLMDLYQALDVYLITIKHLVPQVEQDIGDWETWFTVFDTTDEATLNHSLNVLCDQIAETNWDSEQIKGIVDPLYTLWLETKASTTSLFKQAVEYLMHYFLQEPEFPRNDYIYGELYEIFYGVLNDWARIYQMQNCGFDLLRLD